MKRTTSSHLPLGLAAALAFAFLGAACSTSTHKKPKVSGLDDLAFDPNAHNVALLFGAPNGLPGVARDISEMQNVLSRSDYNFKFDVHADANATTPSILSNLAENAKDLGENGTLLVYLSGHGSRDGQYITVGGSLAFDQVAQAIEGARTTPVKRLLILNDSCFSGNWTDDGEVLGSSLALDGSAAAGDDPSEVTVKTLDDGALTSAAVMAQAFDAAKVSRGGVLAEQVLVFAAASKTETASDLGEGNGGAFTYSFRSVLEELSKDQEHATIQQLVDETVNRTKARFGHTPQAKALPESMLQERVFGQDLGKPVLPPPPNPSNPSNPPTNPVTTTPFQDETAHVSATLAVLNDNLDGCTVKLDQMTKGLDADSHYYFQFSATYTDGTSSEVDASWGDFKASAETEAKAFLDVIPSKYFANCKLKAGSTITPTPDPLPPTTPADPVKKEKAHAAATLAALNAKLDGCTLSLVSIDVPLNIRGLYRFTVKAAYDDGSAAEKRSLPGKFANTADSEAAYFLRSIPQRMFTKCHLSE